LLAADPEEPAGRDAPQRVLAHVKSNYGPLAPSLCLEVRPAVIPANGSEPDAETAFLALSGESDHSGRDLLNVQDPREVGAVGDAEAFLRDQLSDGPRFTDELMPAAVDAGLSWASVRRAKKNLGVQSKKAGGGNGKWSWVLPETRAQGNGSTGDEPVEHLEHIRAASGPDQSSAATHREGAQLPLLSTFPDG
jgi:putative DNA primase/helicase